MQFKYIIIKKQCWVKTKTSFVCTCMNIKQIHSSIKCNTIQCICKIVGEKKYFNGLLLCNETYLKYIKKKYFDASIHVTILTCICISMKIIKIMQSNGYLNNVHIYI